MRNIFTRKEFALAVACALAFGLLSEMASAQVGQDEHAIVMDSNGVPVTSGFGLCLRKCHGELPLPIAQGVAPVAVPAPAPEPVVMATAAPLPIYEKVPTTRAGECTDANNTANYVRYRTELTGL